MRLMLAKLPKQGRVVLPLRRRAVAPVNAGMQNVSRRVTTPTGMAQASTRAGRHVKRVAWA